MVGRDGMTKVSNLYTLSQLAHMSMILKGNDANMPDGTFLESISVWFRTYDGNMTIDQLAEIIPVASRIADRLENIAGEHECCGVR